MTRQSPGRFSWIDPFTFQLDPRVFDGLAPLNSINDL
jgi:hypothetical protein